MGTATVVGRDELGRIIDIQVSTEADVLPPGPEVVTSGGDGGEVAQVLLSRSTTLTDAQIKALPTTAIELVPAPGAGSMLVPIYAILRLNWVADYTNIAAGCQLAVTQDSGSAANPVFLAVLENDPDVSVASLLGLGDSAFAMTGPRMYGGPTASSFVNGAGGFNTYSVENVPLYLRASNSGSGAFTGGDAGNSLKVTVLYTVIEV